MYNGIKTVSFEEAVKVVKSGDRIHIHSVACAPQGLIQALCARGRAGELKNVKIQHLHTEGSAPYAEQEFEGVFQLESFFVGHNVRKATQDGWADYIPVHLSETQKLIRMGITPVDVAMIQVCPPDKHGYVSMGTSVDATLAAVQNAKTVIAVINPHVPRAWGDAIIRLSDIDIFCEDDTPLIEAKPAQPTEQDIQIGKNCAALIEDGACLQMGIGAIPNAVLSQLGNHKNLGIHTEMFADGVLPLYYKGVINNRNKKFDKGKLVSTFLMGSKEVYEFIDDNPAVAMMDVGYTNDPQIIAQQPKMTAINSALSIDLTGQVNADSLGCKFYSGCGGQLDFISSQRRRQTHHRHAGSDCQRHQQNQPDPPQRSRSRDHPFRRALRGDGIRRCRPLWQDDARPRQSVDKHRSTAMPRRTGQSRFRTLRKPLPLRDKIKYIIK